MKKRYLIGALSGIATAAVVTKLLSRPRDVDWERNRAIVFHAGHSRFAEVDGVRVHYQEAGPSGRAPIILIHGFASSTLVWSKVFLELAAKGFRVIAADLLGYGYSAKPRDFDYTIGAQARMVDRLVDKLGLDRAIIVGSSYGGAIAATIALDYPERVERLVLVGAVTNNEPTKYLLMRLFGSPLIGDILSPLLIGSRLLLKRRMKRVYDRHSWVLDDQRIEARHQPLRTAAVQRAIIRTVRRWDADRIHRQAHMITQPTLVLWGDNDAETPLRFGEQLHDAIRDSRLIVFRDCGHLPHEEFPQAFTEVVFDFCSREIAAEDSRVPLEE
ncbi:MAG: alpha/beta hydrolase [Pyrinomonadaceae bacterium]|nr:alpha/beta hydrolase [Pyrinomonadaceae bacterium]